MSASELCAYCKYAKRECFYRNLPAEELQKLRNNSFTESCPQFLMLLGEPLLEAVTSPVSYMVPANTPVTVTSLIAERVISNIIQMPGLDTEPPTKTDRRKREGTTIMLRQYIPIPELLTAMRVTEDYWPAFDGICKAIDATGKYGVDLTPNQREALSKKINGILKKNRVMEYPDEGYRFLVTLLIAVKAWTLNTKGKTIDTMRDFGLIGGDN